MRLARTCALQHSPRHPHSTCYLYRDAIVRDGAPLSDFVGEEGVARLLAFVDREPLRRVEYAGPHAENMREWADLMRRVIVPYYEEARLHLARALEEGFLDDLEDRAVFSPTTLKAVIQQDSG